jgi:hypothetical protein
MLVFSTQLLSKYIINRQCVVGRGRGVLSCVEDYFLQEFNTRYQTRFKTYKIVRPLQTKTYRGGGPQTDKHLPQSPFTGKLYLITTFGIAFYQSFYGVYPSLLNLKQFVLESKYMLILYICSLCNVQKSDIKNEDSVFIFAHRFTD